ncbi:MAG: hypothetical protein HKN46_05105 [Acidimicrobiia bacterium]|nr:hypothetical protein [Acidimicrobiia bacterium]
MDEHDEAFEAIPWDRFTTNEPRFDPRWALVAAVLLLAVGVGAFALRRMEVPAATAAAPAPVHPVTATSSTTTVPVAMPGLWAVEEAVEGPDGVAARFVIGLLDGSGVALVSVQEVGADQGPRGANVVVEAVGTAADGSPVSLGMAVEVAADGTILSWEPRQVAPIEVRPLTEGAVPPPEVLDRLTRIAARWGTALEVTRSGIDGELWWAEFLVGLPGGGDVPLVVWEG